MNPLQRIFMKQHNSQTNCLSSLAISYRTKFIRKLIYSKKTIGRSSAISYCASLKSWRPTRNTSTRNLPKISYMKTKKLGKRIRHLIKEKLDKRMILLTINMAITEKYNCIHQIPSRLTLKEQS
jgi:hypothetical protein